MRNWVAAIFTYYIRGIYISMSTVYTVGKFYASSWVLYIPMYVYNSIMYIVRSAYLYDHTCIHDCVVHSRIVDTVWIVQIRADGRMGGWACILVQETTHACRRT